MLYTKANAQKTDFTRTGKRTFKGMLNDGVNAVQRYVQNHFLDYERQNVYDILSNNIVVKNYKNYKIKVG